MLDENDVFWKIIALYLEIRILDQQGRCVVVPDLAGGVLLEQSIRDSMLDYSLNKGRFDAFAYTLGNFRICSSALQWNVMCDFVMLNDLQRS